MTDIVQKEMYTFVHREKESLTLKPEGTAPVVRAYIEHGMAFFSAACETFLPYEMFSLRKSAKRTI